MILSRTRPSLYLPSLMVSLLFFSLGHNIN
jgi:hypothetical protein